MRQYIGTRRRCGAKRGNKEGSEKTDAYLMRVNCGEGQKRHVGEARGERRHEAGIVPHRWEGARGKQLFIQV